MTNLMSAYRTILVGAAFFYVASGTMVVAQSEQRGDGPEMSPARSYSEAQAKRGKALSADNCAACHGEDLAGAGLAPALAGSTFLSLWEGRTVGDLYEQVRTTMPASAPGSLSNDDYIDLIAFILQANDVPSGERDLKANAPALKTMVFRKR